MSNVATHYRQAEDLLGEAEDMARKIDYGERAQILAIVGLGHAELAQAPATAVAGAQREREEMEAGHEAAAH